MKIIGQKILQYETVTSTNDILKELGDGAEEGTVVVAAQQTQGRGRGDRSWHSPKDLGLYLSVLLHPHISIRLLGMLSLFPAVAVVRALSRSYGFDAKVKWPNDILLDGKKIGGVLCEAKSDASEVKQLIVGIGLNLFHQKKDFPESLQKDAASILMCTDLRVDYDLIFQNLLQSLEDVYRDMIITGKLFDLHDEWMRYCGHVGKEVSVQGGTGKEITGTFVGIGMDGAALLQTADNKRIEIKYGDFSLRI